MRALHVDATPGATLDALLSALVDLGVAPSPILRAVAELDVGVELRIEDTRVAAIADPGALVPPLDVDDVLARASLPEDARLIVADAVGRLLVAEGEGRAESLDKYGLDARALSMLAACALAIAQLAPDRVAVTRVGAPSIVAPPLAQLLARDLVERADATTTVEAAALLRALSPAWGAREPQWRGHAARGRSSAPPEMALAMGDAYRV